MPRRKEPHPLMLPIAERIRLLRNSADLSLKALSSASGLSAGELSGIEGGLVCITLPTLCKLATGLGVDVAVLLAEPVSRFGALAERASHLSPEGLQALDDRWDDLVLLLQQGAQSR